MVQRIGTALAACGLAALLSGSAAARGAAAPNQFAIVAGPAGEAFGPPAPAGPPAPPPSAAAATPVPVTTAPKPAASSSVPPPVRVSDDPRPTLGPETFTATLGAIERYRAIVEAGGWPTVPNDATRLRPGGGGAAVRALRGRLAATGDLAEEARAGDLFDEALVAAVKRFQARHGLDETGLVGPRTLVQLNVPAAARLRQLQASEARLMGSRFPFGNRYVVVNIPSATVEAVEHGSVVRRYVAVVGKTDRPSPTVETRITSVNFNPTWTVPVSLIRKDIIPHVRKDPNYLAKMKIRLFDGQGNEVDPGTIDWSTERAVNYTVRQDSGTENSLGEIRIDMPNRHAVYMHDTPSKRLFARTARTQSSGCVRVAGVKALTQWLLEASPGPAASGPGAAGATWGAAEIDAAIASGTRQDVRLVRPVPVAWTYLTGYAVPDGTVQFRDDVYGLDDPAAASPAGPPSQAPLTLDALVTSSIKPAR